MPCTASSDSPVAVEIVMLNGLYERLSFSAMDECNMVFEHPVSMRHFIFIGEGGIVKYMNDNSAPILVALRWSLELLSFCSCLRKSIEAEIYESMCDKGVGCTKFCTKSANNAGWVIVKSG